MKTNTAKRHLLPALFLALLVAACGGGGDDLPSTATPPPSSGPVPGSLTITGASAASVGGNFTPASLGTPAEQGPDCAVIGAATVCSSSLAVGWTESSAEGLVAIFGAVGLASPGAAPGTGINSLNLTYSVLLSNGFTLVCGPINNTTCDFQALGVTLDTVARTVRFVNTPLASAAPGGDGVVANGVIGY